MKGKLVFLLMLGALLGKAQTYSLSFGYYDPVISDTAHMEGILGVSANIVNTGENTINTPLHLVFALNSCSGIVDGILAEYDEFSLSPNDSVHVGWPVVDTITSGFNGGYINVNQQNGFFEGDNIIVVWPAVPNIFLEEGAVVIVEQYIQQVHVIDNITGLKTHLKKPDFRLLLSSDSKLEVEGIGKEINRLELMQMLVLRYVHSQIKLKIHQRVSLLFRQI
jgi:hypothetical protein